MRCRTACESIAGRVLNVPAISDTGFDLEAAHFTLPVRTLSDLDHSIRRAQSLLPEPHEPLAIRSETVQVDSAVGGGVALELGADDCSR